jgi:hypothetical protein
MLIYLLFVLAQVSTPITLVVPGDRFAWTMQGPSLALVSSYRYEVEVNGQRLTNALEGVLCLADPAPKTTFTCTAPIPVSLGPHVLRVRSVDATIPGAPAIEGAWSPSFVYDMQPMPPMLTVPRVVPPAPGLPRVIKPTP